jgi:hypothetical protein
LRGNSPGGSQDAKLYSILHSKRRYSENETLGDHGFARDGVCVYRLRHDMTVVSLAVPRFQYGKVLAFLLVVLGERVQIGLIGPSKEAGAKRLS